jgi:4'-phosphopantetheinyl transferase
VNIDRLIRTLVRPSADFAWAWALERDASEPLNERVLPALTAEAIAPPLADELILWFGEPGTGDWPNLRNYLSQAERARASSFRFEADGWSFAAAHASLRVLLGQMVACAPHALRFATGANGKPSLDRDYHSVAVQFSISHTRRCVAIAIAGSAVGIDVEQRRLPPDLMAIARTVFAGEACDALAACSSQAARIALFYRHWTLGEAFSKATGEGVAQNLGSFAFTSQGAPALVRVSTDWGPVARWRFYCEPLPCLPARQWSGLSPEMAAFSR